MSESFSYILRTCTELRDDGDYGEELTRSRNLRDFREVPAYILLADPGAGKTEEFRREAREVDGQFVTARDFITFDSQPEWRDATLFIDGLDEARAAISDGRTVLDAIRVKLQRLGCPNFRLSCRAADWLGPSDRTALESISRDGHLRCLQLDPLTEDDIRLYLESRSEIPDSHAFIDGARQHGMAELLSNPQILITVIETVARDGRWPTSRLEIYDNACQHLVLEHNHEHEAAQRTKPMPVEILLDAAGKLSTIALISDFTGYALAPTTADSRRHIHYARVDPQAPAPLAAALRSKLFRLGESEGLREPAHRTVAEYLAARYLTKRLKDNHLIPSRLLSLLCGPDGGVVAALRGLYGWLATTSLKARQMALERDPVGVLQHGDISTFKTPEKHALLEALRVEAENDPRLHSKLAHTLQLKAFCSEDMEDTLREILQSPSRARGDQLVTALIIDALTYNPLTQLTLDLMKLVRDNSCWEGNRVQALRALLLHPDATKDSELRETLASLTEELLSRTISDKHDRLLGHLLKHFYPSHIPPQRIFNYFRVPPQGFSVSSVTRFWTRGLIEQSTNEQLSIVTDELVARDEVREQLLQDLRLRRMPAALLVRIIERLGDLVSCEKLYDWLGIALDRHGRLTQYREYSQAVAAWLSCRPDKYKGLYQIALARSSIEEPSRHKLYAAERRFYGATPPADIGTWCLQQIEAGQSHGFEEHLFLLAARRSSAWMIPDEAEYSLDFLRRWAEATPPFDRTLDQPGVLYCLIPDGHHDHKQQLRGWEAEEQQRKADWMELARQNIATLRAGSAPPALLYDFALAYYGRLQNVVGDTPQERLASIAENEEELVSAALLGFAAVVSCTDLPSPAEIIDLYREGSRHLIGLPYLAGISEFAREEAENIRQLSDEQIARAIALHLVNSDGDDPPWLSTALSDRPELAAGLLIHYASTRWAMKAAYSFGIYPLAFDENYKPVARHAAIPLLSRFPVRAGGRRVEELEYLLKAALQFADVSELLDLIPRKLATRSLGASQKVLWLTAGFLVDTEGYEAKLLDYTTAAPIRLRTLAGFLSGRRDQFSLDRGLNPEALLLLIELLGRNFAPRQWLGSGRVTPEMRASDCVEELIERLGGDPGPSASNVLARLELIPHLKHWRLRLRDALHRQQVLRRESEYSHPTFTALLSTLENREPANSTDLRALTVHYIDEIGRNMRDASSNDYKQYWNVNPRGRIHTPRPENICRDALFAALRPLLARHDVELTSEARYADDTRADIRVSYGGVGGINVPIEAKKDNARDLWQAPREQLIKRYARDPGAQGNGIFVVFWFGGTSIPRAPRGPTPRCASELRSHLIETLNGDERQRVEVCVLDCRPEKAQ